MTFDLAVNDDGCCIGIDGAVHDYFDMHYGSSFELADCDDVLLYPKYTTHN